MTNCARVARLANLWLKTLENWSLSESLDAKKLKLDTLKKFATLKIWPVLTIFHTFAQNKINKKKEKTFFGQFPRIWTFPTLIHDYKIIEK